MQAPIIDPVSDHECAMIRTVLGLESAGQLTSTGADQLLDQLGTLMGAVLQGRQQRRVRHVQVPKPGPN